MTDEFELEEKPSDENDLETFEDYIDFFRVNDIDISEDDELKELNFE
jgi:hypothetical protein